MRPTLAIGLLSLLTLFGLARAATPIRTLDLKSFEHETQAATGQTTGHWYVLFVDEEDAQLVRLWRQLAEEEHERNPWLIFAVVDSAANPELAERFSIESTPAALLFRDRKMYKAGSLSSAHASMKQASGGAALHEPSTGMMKTEIELKEALREFCQHGWSASQALEVPAPPGWLESALHRISLAVTRETLYMATGAVIGVGAVGYAIYDQTMRYFQAATPKPAGKEL